MKRSERLVEELVDGLKPVGRPPAATGSWVLWLACSLLFVLAATHLAGPIRPGSLAQLETVPRFAGEMIIGALAAAGLGLVAFRAAVPGLPQRGLLWISLGLAGLWLGNFFLDFAYPTLEPSMLGKRDHCIVETLLFGTPPLLALLYWQRRQLTLAPRRSAIVAGLAAGMLPALYMQVACMYAPGHILAFHVGPAVILAALAGLAPSIGRSRTV